MSNMIKVWAVAWVKEEQTTDASHISFDAGLCDCYTNQEEAESSCESFNANRMWNYRVVSVEVDKDTL